ncbi:MAG: hypothetical protein J3K34DRAFT_414087 [Monoraphidium minutum]|nr:MAG: hypothetical protein J3K34DRAFT_414087 [Monoraphidium minutum]
MATLEGAPARPGAGPGRGGRSSSTHTRGEGPHRQAAVRASAPKAERGGRKGWARGAPKHRCVTRAGRSASGRASKAIYGWAQKFERGTGEQRREGPLGGGTERTERRAQQGGNAARASARGGERGGQIGRRAAHKSFGTRELAAPRWLRGPRRR